MRYPNSDYRRGRTRMEREAFRERDMFPPPSAQGEVVPYDAPRPPMGEVKIYPPPEPRAGGTVPNVPYNPHNRGPDQRSRQRERFRQLFRTGVRTAGKLNQAFKMLDAAWDLMDLMAVINGHKAAINVPGFTQTATCLAPSYDGWVSASSGAATNCEFGTGNVAGVNGLATPIPAAQNFIKIMLRHYPVTGQRTSHSIWTRQSAGIVTASAIPISFAEPWPMQMPWPQLDPFALPIGLKPWVFPAPQPIPWFMLPMLKPSPYRDVGYAVRPRTLTRTGGGKSFEFRGGRWSTVPPKHKFKEPPPRMKEGKYVVRVAGVAQRIINIATESLDVIDALYDALPCEAVPHFIIKHDREGGMVLPKWRKPKEGEMTAGQKHPKPYYQKPAKAGDCVKRKVPVKRKLELLYKNWDKVDVQDAIQNLVANEIEDRLFGSLGKAQGRAAQNAANKGFSGRPVGVEFGPAI